MCCNIEVSRPDKTNGVRNRAANRGISATKKPNAAAKRQLQGIPIPTRTCRKKCFTLVKNSYGV